MLINADIGEMMGDDAAMMPFLGMGNIACGGHASNAAHMAVTVDLAVSHGVKICAHPGYLDKKNFGRLSMPCSRSELFDLVDTQVKLLHGICASRGCTMDAIKPHGALYHDMMRDPVVREVMVESAKKYAVPLVIQAGSQAVDWGVELLREVFADRAYMSNGSLVSRTQLGSVYDDAGEIVSQSKRLIAQSSVRCVDGEELVMEADTLCFHGDNLASVKALKLLSL